MLCRAGAKHAHQGRKQLECRSKSVAPTDHEVGFVDEDSMQASRGRGVLESFNFFGVDLINSFLIPKEIINCI